MVIQDSTGDNKSSKKVLVAMTQWLFGCTENIQSLHKILFPNSTAHEQIPGVYTRVDGT